MRDVTEEFFRTLRVVPQQHEGIIDAHVPELGDCTLGLLDDDAAVQRGLKLLGENLAATDGALLEQPDRCHVRQGLCHVDLGRLQAPDLGTEYAKRRSLALGAGAERRAER